VRSDPSTDFGAIGPMPGQESRRFEDGVSFSGHERNHLFLNAGGETFHDVSGVSGLDDPADARVFAWLDVDRDGRLDLAVVNANRPLLQIFHNRIREAGGAEGAFVALRFVGANRGPDPRPGASPRDGYGARATLRVGDATLVREHRAGEGFAAQNSATRLVGLGPAADVDAIEVSWPSGRTQTVTDVPAGSLVTFHEDPGAATAGRAATVEPYAPPSPVALGDGPAAPPGAPLAGLPADALGAPITVVTTVATWCEACRSDLPQVATLDAAFADARVALVGAPVDEADAPEAVRPWGERHRPAYRLLDALPIEGRRAIQARVAAELGRDGVPASFVVDARGRVLQASWGVPTVSQLRRIAREAGVRPPGTARAPAAE